MRPLNYSVLKYFTTVEEACVEDVMAALKSEYENFKAFNHKSTMKSLMTAEANAVLEESHFEFDESKRIRVYYRITEEGKNLVKTYIKD